MDGETRGKLSKAESTFFKVAIIVILFLAFSLFVQWQVSTEVKKGTNEILKALAVPIPEKFENGTLVTKKNQFLAPGEALMQIALNQRLSDVDSSTGNLITNKQLLDAINSCFLVENSVE